jgi:hypothetical protein
MNDWSDDELERLLSQRVSYMEIAEEAGGFSCGRCEWADSGFCTNPEVDAPVSPDHGCCNRFKPAPGVRTFPP